MNGQRYWYDEEAAERAVGFFAKFLRHVKGEWAGQKLVLQDWAANEIVRPLFGWKRPDGLRKYRTVYVEVPRKNAKSTIAAGIGLYLTFADGEPGAEVVSAAADREQAAIVFDIARQMVMEEPALKTRSIVYQRAIRVPKTNSVYKVISADVKTKHGANLHGIIFDELHAQPNRGLWDVLTTSRGSRRQPVIFAITTAGYDRNSICWEQHDYAMKVKQGIINDPTFLPVLYGIPEDMDWRTDEALAMANPGLGVTVYRENLEEERRKAIEVAGFQNTFRRLYLNQWTEQETKWLPMEIWREKDLCVAVNPEELRGRVCYGGLDLSSTTDFSAFVLIFPPQEDDEKWKLLVWLWLPEAMFEKRSRMTDKFREWARDDFIHVTGEDTIDYDFIRSTILEQAERYQIIEICFDRWNGTQLATQLAEDGAEMVPIGQGFAAMTSPAKELERLLVSRELQHGGNPALDWMASNVVAKMDPAGNLKPDKGSSGDRIDGIAALCDALAGALRHGDERSKYETEGLLVI